MKDGIRVVLVDPSPESRPALIEQIESMGSVWLAEVCVAYRIAPGRVAELRPDLTIVVPDADPAQAVETVGAIVQDNPAMTVLSASRSEDSTTVLNLLRNGARELLPLPVETGLLYRTIKRLTQQDEEPPQAPVAEGPSSKTIAVTGATGEVGCTSLAVNLATTLAKSTGQDVVLVDFELMFGAVDALLDLVPENTLSHVVKSIDRLDITLLRRMLCRHASGLYVLPRPVELQDSAKLVPESLRQALAMLRSTFPLVVLDTSKSLQASDFVAFETADVILVVTQLDPTSVRNTTRLLDCFRQMDGFIERIQVVANRVGSQRSTVAQKKAEEAFQMPVAWQIPNATKTFHNARDRGVPIDTVTSRSEAHRAIVQIAKALAPSPAAVVARPSRGFFRDRFQREA
jgi:pilus assembly protein CpaE